MSYGPDFSSSDEDGLSDDNDYYDFKQRMKAKQLAQNAGANTEADRHKALLKSVFSAISYGKVDEVIEEFNKGLDLNVDLESGWTPLLLAATVANVGVISHLIQKKVDVNQTRATSSPLLLVCNVIADDESLYKDVFDSVKLLVEAGADVNFVDNKRRTALMLAACNGHIEVVKLLLPLGDKEAEDNQKWNALFWAVDGNKAEVVAFLLHEGFNCDKTDIRNDTVMEIANNNGFEDVLKLFPQASSDQFYLYLSNNTLNFEELFQSGRPQFFTEICKILYGAKSEGIIPLVVDHDVFLSDFLAANEKDLEEIGIKLPFQRKRILSGLFRLHKHPFNPKSIPYVPKKGLYTNIDVASTLMPVIKQIVVMEASLNFILKNYDENQEGVGELEELSFKIRKEINRLKIAISRIVKKTEQWDQTLKPVDLIIKKRRNIPWSNIFGVLTLASLTFLIWKLKKF